MSNAQDYYMLMLRQLNGGLPVNTIAPILGASPVVGTQLAYTRGVWTDTTSRSTQAQRRRLGGSWANVGSAWDSVVGTPYTPVSADAFYTFKAIETSTPGSVTATSNETSEAIISGLALRLDASDASTLFQDSAGTVPATADNDVIGRWADRSTNSNTPMQVTTANKPLLKTMIQNGRNIIRFDGTDDNLAFSGNALNIAKNVGYVYVFAVYNPRHTANTQRVMLLLRTGVGNGRILIDDGVAANRLRLFWRRLDADAPTAITSGTNHGGVSVVITAAFAFGDGAIALRQNGIQVATATIASGNTSNTASTAATIGDTTTATSIGDMSEMLILTPTVALTSGEIAAVESYLNAKWAVY